MKDSDFLSKLKAEGKLELVEISEPIAKSYENKSRDCLQAATLVFNGGLYENAIGEAYYSMYNSLQSLFFRCGIKCENHGAASLLLKRLFCVNNLSLSFSKAKEERIDKQYYITTAQANPVTKESAQALINTASKFILDVSDYKRNLKLSQIEELRKRFDNL